MRVGVLGAGCVGAIVASQLQKIGADVSLLASGERAEKLRSRGVTVNDTKFTFNVPLAGSGEHYDLIVVCVKNYQLSSACKDLEFFVADNTVILPLLNSISPTPIISSYFPSSDVLYGYISKIDSLRHNNGHFTYNISGEIHLGRAVNQEKDDVVENIALFLQHAGFEVVIDEDMIRGIWKKWMLNIGANQVSALTEANYLQFSEIPEIECVLRMAMDELLVLAHLESINLIQSDIDELITYLTTYPYPKRTSMLQDVLNRRKTEIEAISGEVVNLSDKWDQPCPVNRTMFYLIRAKEQAYMNKFTDGLAPREDLNHL